MYERSAPIQKYYFITYSWKRIETGHTTGIRNAITDENWVNELIDESPVKWIAEFERRQESAQEKLVEGGHHPGRGKIVGTLHFFAEITAEEYYAYKGELG